MFGCWLLTMNYEEYQKKAAETDAKISALEELEEAYVVKLDAEYFEVEGSEDNEYFYVVVGEHHVLDEAQEIVFALDEDYPRYQELCQKGKKMNEEEIAEVMCLGYKFAVTDGGAITEEFQALIGGNSSDNGEVLKRVK